MRVLCVFGRHAYGNPSRGESYEHANFLPAFVGLGHQVELFDSFDRTAYSDFADLNLRLIERVRSFRPDVIFCVLMHYEVWFETLDLIRATTPAVVINWGTDDSWKFRQFSRFLARRVDLHATTDANALAEARRVGLTSVVASQWAASSAALAAPLPASQCTHDVSFVGAAYGNRRKWVEALARRGVRVACFGHGWDNGAVDTRQLRQIYRSSRISLNFADSGLQLSSFTLARSRQIKARTFEVPGSGGFLMSEHADGLDQYLRPNEDIVTFDAVDELATKIRYFLDRADERDRVANAGHLRVRRDHVYEVRFAGLLEQAKQRLVERGERGWQVDSGAMSPLVEDYRRSTMLHSIVATLRRMEATIFRSERGMRALRRLAFEVSWRLRGEAVYGAKGLPGRVFYGES